ncbi:hypothetical protein D5086_015015 [Populus alba]|uniref:Uncharacterized protein n=1 Tax=Populus alba TaxID=43335 RepID=A0ACC4BZL5_POPAL
MTSVNCQRWLTTGLEVAVVHFGGASEKLVNRYATIICMFQWVVCMLNSTAVTLCSDDLAGLHHTQDYTDEGGIHDVCGPSWKTRKPTKAMELQDKSEIFPQWLSWRCFSLLDPIIYLLVLNGSNLFAHGAHLLLVFILRANGDMPVDDGVRLLNATFPLLCQLVDQLTFSASGKCKDELSFRTVVRDLRTKSPMLQIVLVNPNSWCCSGDCLDTKSNTDSVLKLDLHPVIKVLFSDL